MLVPDGHGSRVARNLEEPDRSLDLLGLAGPRVGGEIGGDNAAEDLRAVFTEGLVVEALPEVVAVAVDTPAVGKGERQQLVVPVPDKAALEGRVPVHELPVLGEVARGVALGEGVFAQDHGAALARTLHHLAHPVE